MQRSLAERADPNWLLRQFVQLLVTSVPFYPQAPSMPRRGGVSSGGLRHVVVGDIRF